MTLTFHSDKYIEHLSRYQPKLIRTEEENEKALAIVEELMHRSNRSPEENELYEFFIVLIEKFEQEYYSLGADSTLHLMLLFLMEQQNFKPSNLLGVFGAEEIVLAVIDGKREISQTEAQGLGKLLNVDSGLFLR